jgi:hypothetical protein
MLHKKWDAHNLSGLRKKCWFMRGEMAILGLGNVAAVTGLAMRVGLERGD